MSGDRPCQIQEISPYSRAGHPHPERNGMAAPGGMPIRRAFRACPVPWVEVTPPGHFAPSWPFSTISLQCPLSQSAPSLQSDILVICRRPPSRALGALLAVRCLLGSRCLVPWLRSALPVTRRPASVSSPHSSLSSPLAPRSPLSARRSALC